jgi:uncharacterized membrane protein
MPAAKGEIVTMIATQSNQDAFVLSKRLRITANISLWLLFLLCIAWETFLAPLRPGGSWMFLKALPLVFAFKGVAQGNLYTMQWASMLVLLYLMEGVVRVMSDPPGPSIPLAWVEIVLSVTFFLAAIFYVRPAKKAAQLAAKARAAAPPER